MLPQRSCSSARGVHRGTRSRALLTFSLFVLVVGTASAQAPSWLDVDLEALQLRRLGPDRAGSWVTDIAVPRTDATPTTFYVAARHGGVWKTTNLGTTFENVTDAYDIAAVGDIAVAPSDASVLWVGTGDAEVARSSYSGTGVYLSTDAGATFTHRGLEDSHHIARIVPHPERPREAWVASMGHLFSENSQRGVFHTADGGETWTHQLDLGPRIGVVDLVIDPSNPQRLFAAAYEKQRLPWHFEAGGAGSGLYRSDDGGSSWKRLGGGLPEGDLGRIGIDVCRAQPETLYAVIENLTPSGRTTDRPEEEVVGNEVYRSDDGGASWRQVSPKGLQIGSKSAYAFNEVRVHPEDPESFWITSETLISSVDGGATYRDLKWPATERFSRIFGDVRTLWIDPDNPEHLLVGSDGGVFPSWDGGRTSSHLQLPLGEIYGVEVDDDLPYNVYAGLQDHEAWRAPVASWSGAVGPEDWVIVGKWDGMVSRVDSSGRWFYGTTQFGNHVRADLDRGTRKTIVPKPPEGVEVPGGRGGYRFTWVTPLLLSPWNEDVLYTGSHKVLRSDDRGETWREISPDLTTDDAVRIAGEGHIRYCTITTLDESPLQAGMLWAGTDDGRVWHSDGQSWRNVDEALARAGAPEDRWVSRVLASQHSQERAFVAKNGYRRDDFGAYLYRTDDGGKSWTEIGTGLPDAPISVVLEDPRNANLLYIGNDRGVFVTLDGGTHWRPLHPSLPPAVVRDLALQERDLDLVVGTYGRGLWIVDVEPLAELALAAETRLFPITPAPVELTQRDDWGAYRLYGDSVLHTDNPPDGLTVYAWLNEASGAKVTLRSAEGEDLSSEEIESVSGLHRVHLVAPEPGRYSVELETATGSSTRPAVLLPMPRHPITSRPPR
ncbi:MAG: hypothetical protein AAGA81_05330 [Acidobacteriota bacterium]